MYSLCGVKSSFGLHEENAPKSQIQLAIRVIMKYDRNFLVLGQWQKGPG